MSEEERRQLEDERDEAEFVVAHAHNWENFREAIAREDYIAKRVRVQERYWARQVGI